MFSITRLWEKSQFLRNVAKVSSGKLSAMIIAVAATPVISRLFDPSHYGVAALFIAAMTIASSVLALAYEQAAIYPREDAKASRIVVLALTVSVSFSLLMYLAISIRALLWPGAIEGSSLGSYVWLLPLGALLLSVKGIAAALCVRRGDFSAIASADVADAATAASTRILWGLLLTSSTAGLLLGHLLALAVAALVCGIPSLLWFRKCYERRSLKELWAVAVEFKDYPVFRAPARITFSTSMKLPIIALGILFPTEIVGFYAMANRAAGRPLQAIRTSVSSVLLSKTMKLRHVGQPLGKNLLRVAAVLALAGVPLFSLMFVFGEEAITWFLGARWATAGEFVRIMAPYLFALWVGAFVPTVFDTLRLNKLRLKLNIGNLLLRAGIFIACGALGLGITVTLWIFVMTSCAYQAFIYTIAVKVIMAYDADLLHKNRNVGEMDIEVP